MMIEVTDGLQPGDQVVVEINIPADFGGRGDQNGPQSGQFPGGGAIPDDAQLTINGQPVTVDAQSGTGGD